MPQLDGLRALAVTSVVLEHYHVVKTGAVYGVHLFFVLSGFLITGILMKSRSAIEVTGVSWTHAFRQFYIRRALRIFPLYYLVLLVAVAINASGARENAVWLFTYTINLKMAAQGWYIANFAHFWSLAVEEQYYLFWPVLILLLPRRRLIPAAVILTAIGPLFRLSLALWWLLVAKTISPLNTYIATPTALDSLGIGSLISIVASMHTTRVENRGSIAIAIATTFFLIAGALITNAWWIFPDTIAAGFFGWLIYSAARGFGGVLGRALAARPLVFTGRISYGIYVFHPLVPPAVLAVCTSMGVKLPEGFVGSFVCVVLTLLVATVSWYSFESPLNSLKRRFPPVEGELIDSRALRITSAGQQ